MILERNSCLALRNTSPRGIIVQLPHFSIDCFLLVSYLCFTLVLALLTYYTLLLTYSLTTHSLFRTYAFVLTPYSLWIRLPTHQGIFYYFDTVHLRYTKRVSPSHGPVSSLDEGEVSAEFHIVVWKFHPPVCFGMKAPTGALTRPCGLS